MRTWLIAGFVSLAWCFVCIVPSSAATGEVACVMVRTRAEHNSSAAVWYRVPCDYRKVPGRRWRTLVIFGGRNCSGDADTARDILSRDFVARARAAVQSVIWKSFPNHPHDVPPEFCDLPPNAVRMR